jgi:precorrin-6B methylase 2
MKKYFGLVKGHIKTLFWDIKLFCILLLKDFFRVISFFDKKYLNSWKYFLEKYLEESNKRVKLRNFGRFLFYLRNHDLFSLEEVFLDKDYSLLEEFLPKRNDIVLDLGAGVGDYALFSSIRVGGGKIVSVEADPKTFQLLKKNIEENKLKNVIPINIFVSSEREHSIDFIVEKLKLKRVDLIKMDIEGGEYNALKGAIKTIRKFKPKIIIEIHSKNLREKILGFLKNYGYNLAFEKEKKDYGFYLSYFKFIIT